MIKRIPLKRITGIASLAILGLTQAANAQDLTSMRACARALSINVEGDRFYEGFPSEDENSMYFIDCDENPKLGKDHLILTTNGVYTIFEKLHNDYKGGLAPTLYRFTLENETYYFKVNIFGEMGDVFDFKGDNLSKSPVTQDKKIDISAKNPILTYYMKTLTGRTDAKAALQAYPLPAERIEKSRICLRKKMDYLGKVLYRTYPARFRDDSIDPVTLARYRETAVKALSSPSCHTDPDLSLNFNAFLANLP